MNFLQKKTFQDLTYFKLGSNLFGKPQMHVYSYLIDGVLIDTGQPRIRKELLNALKKEVVQKILVTHHHEDHSGNIEAIKQLKGIEAYASPLCCEILINPPKVEPARWVTWGQMPKAQTLPLPQNEQFITPNGLFSFEVLDTPGHAIDQISLYEPNRGWLFSGDLFVHDYVKVFMRDENIAEQITSIQKLLELDFEVMFCNHQPVFSDAKPRLQNKLQFLQDFYGKIEGEYKKGFVTPKEIMKALGMKEYRFMQAFSLGQLSRINMVKSVVRCIEIL
ncbi:MAG: MBL fold metallo-hydrolase [Chitinophagales bacterium]